MPNNSNFFGLLALMFAISAGMPVPASAEFFGCNDKHSRVVASYDSARSSGDYTHEFAAQSARPRITVRPRHHVGRYAVRYCRSWLAKEYRVSGPVIVPQMRCTWD
jgi:hypothetical protein